MSGGGKKRRDIAAGEARSADFANLALAQTEPFANTGTQAINQLAALGGFQGPGRQAQVGDTFNNSLFYTAGQNAFGLEKDAIDTALSSQGLLHSQARLNAVEDARQRNFQSAFNNFLQNSTNIATIGANAAAGQASTLNNQANTAFDAGLERASTRRGVLGTLGDIALIGKGVARGFGGF